MKKIQNVRHFINLGLDYFIVQGQGQSLSSVGLNINTPIFTHGCKQIQMQERSENLPS